VGVFHRKVPRETRLLERKLAFQMPNMTEIPSGNLDPDFRDGKYEDP